MELLIPDGDKRAVVECELHEMPIRFYETPIELPEAWWVGSGAYVLLSEGYQSDASRAAQLGWPVATRLGGHLDIVNESEAIASILLEISAQPRQPAGS
jgi:hypothetical protein